MPRNVLKVSTELQSLIDKGLLDGLPVSFSAFCLDQMKEWELLFPAERNYYERLFGLLDRSTQAAVDMLFEPVLEIERKMGVNEKTWPKGQFTLEQVDFLNRNSHFPEWRNAVSGVFAQLDPLLDAEIERDGHSRLVIVIAPRQLPVGPDRMWMRLPGRGKRVAIEAPDRVEQFVPLLLTGQEQARRAPTIADLFGNSKKGGSYTTWVVETGTGLSALTGDSKSVVKYSYESLQQYRKRLMREVQRVVDTQEAQGPRQLSARLKQLKILGAEGDMVHYRIFSEFARAI